MMWGEDGEMFVTFYVVRLAIFPFSPCYFLVFFSLYFSCSPRYFPVFATL